ncbi:MAG: HAD hydrolase-like protein [Rubricoccaceae bacterium]
MAAPLQSARELGTFALSLSRSLALSLVPIQALLLDMDGVLVDVSGSFRRAITETVAHFTGSEPVPGAIQAKKDEGGFNNDWVLSHTLIREAGQDMPFEAVKAHFQSIYTGEDYSGLITTEPAFIQTQTLESLAERVGLALVTGRPEADAGWTLRRHGWDRLIPIVIGMGKQGDRGKPDPYGLHLALDGLGVAPDAALFAGDTVDDMRAASAAGCTGVGVVPPGHPFESHSQTLLDAGARTVLSTPDDLPGLLDALA